MNIYEGLKQISKTELNSYINEFINSNQEEFIKFYKFRHHYTFRDKESIQSFTSFLDIISNLILVFPFSIISLLDSFCFLSLSQELSNIITKDLLIKVLSSPLSTKYEIKELSENTSLIMDNGCPLLFLFTVSDEKTVKYIISFISDNISIDTIYPNVYKDYISKISMFMSTAFLKLLKEYMEAYEYEFKTMGE